MNNKKETVVQASNLTKKFGDLIAVDNISFSIKRGEVIGILGPNGAGKTTIIRMITGVLQLEDKARVVIFSKDITIDPIKYKKNFGIVPEISNAYSDYSVWQNLKFSGGIICHV